MLKKTTKLSQLAIILFNGIFSTVGQGASLWKISDVNKSSQIYEYLVASGNVMRYSVNDQWDIVTYTSEGRKHTGAYFIGKEVSNSDFWSVYDNPETTAIYCEIIQGRRDCYLQLGVLTNFEVSGRFAEKLYSIFSGLSRVAVTQPSVLLYTKKAYGYAETARIICRRLASNFYCSFSK